MNQDLFTELTTINDKTLQIDVYTDNKKETEGAISSGFPILRNGTFFS